MIPRYPPQESHVTSLLSTARDEMRNVQRPIMALEADKRWYLDSGRDGGGRRMTSEEVRTLIYDST